MLKKITLLTIVSFIFLFIIYKEFLGTKKNSNSAPNSWDIALIEGNKAFDRYNIQEARKYYIESLLAAEKIWGKNSKQAGASYNKLGVIALSENDYDEAEKNMRQAWLISDKLLKDSDHKKGYILGNYAQILRKLGRLEEAEQAEEKAARLIELTNPPIWRDRAKVKLGLVRVYSARGKVDQIDNLLDQAIEDFKKEINTNYKYKLDRQTRAETATDFAYELNNFGRSKAALYFAQKATELNLTEFGQESIQYSNSIKSLANVYESLGASDEAEKNYKLALKVLNAEEGKSILRGQLYVRLAWLKYDRFNLREAVEYAQQAQSEISGALGPEHPENCYTHRILASFLLDSGKFEEASEHAQKALSLAIKEQASDKPDLIGATKIFVYTRLLTQKVDDVMPLLYKLAEKSYIKPGTLNLFSRIELLAALSDLSRMLGRYNDAQQFIEQARKIVPEDSVWFIDIYLTTAKNLRDMGQIKQAVDLAEQANRKANQISPRSGKQLWAMRVLANTYRIAKQYEQGAKIYRQSIELINSVPWLSENKMNKLNIYKELADLYMDQKDDSRTLFDILKIYRGIYQSHPYQSLSVYLPRLVKLHDLSKQHGDSALTSELNNEIEKFKLLLKSMAKIQESIASAIEEEMQRQRKESTQVAQNPKLQEA